MMSVAHWKSGERTRLADRSPVGRLGQEEHFGEAPKWAREARALPGVFAARF